MTYQKLLDRVEEITLLNEIENFLSWDKETMMPEKGLKPRNMQMTVLSNLQHKKITSDRLGELIEKVDEDELDDEQKSVLREVKRTRKRAVKVPDELNEKISEQISETVDTWKEAKQKNDFELFAEEFEKLVELKRKYAKEIDEEREPYEVLFEDYEPYLDLEKAEEIIKELKRELPKVFEQMKNSDVEIESDALEHELSREKNMELAERTARTIGLKEEETRIDISKHPFTHGNQFESRITTRFKEDSVAENIAIITHEGGHALYNLGVPEEEYGNPLGQPRELTIHESQSRLWETHVGRSREFWEYFSEEINDFSDKFDHADPVQFYRAANRVDAKNKIRVEADEISYHLHIAIRFELERRLVNGGIEVEELPALWNQKMEELMGVKPENAGEGVLQDIHWAWGNFGYFPNYTLGSVLAAQLFATAEDEIDDLDGKIAGGEFDPLLKWLREKIHRHGQMYKTEELIERATGEKLKPDYFLNYVKDKYRKLYRVEQ